MSRSRASASATARASPGDTTAPRSASDNLGTAGGRGRHHWQSRRPTPRGARCRTARSAWAAPAHRRRRTSAPRRVGHPARRHGRRPSSRSREAPVRLASPLPTTSRRLVRSPSAARPSIAVARPLRSKPLPANSATQASAGTPASARGGIPMVAAVVGVKAREIDAVVDDGQPRVGHPVEVADLPGARVARSRRSRAWRQRRAARAPGAHGGRSPAAARWSASASRYARWHPSPAR